MSNPYATLPERNFWKPAVGSRGMMEIADLWRPKFPISRDVMTATAGSCFAQHISRAMKSVGVRWMDSEPAPRWLTPEQARAQNYGVFSFRTGNIYTAAMLRQWLQMATGERPATDEVWRADDDRCYDPLRPAIAPGGFLNETEVRVCREQTLYNIYESLPRIDLFVFTLGLTEGWRNRRSGLAYAMAPGAAAGNFDPGEHAFHNYGFEEIREDLAAAIGLLRNQNFGMRFLLTVSPVPLTATASGDHVLAATTYSKSVLRAVAGELARSLEHVDYFPSYEMISSFPFKGAFFEPNMRDVTASGVAHVMKAFFDGQQWPSSPSADERADAANLRAVEAASDMSLADEDPDENIVCEDALLEAFAPGNSSQ